MKNFLKAIILLATISVASVVFPSCSDNEVETDITLKSSNPEKVIAGKWRLQKVGSFRWTGKEKTVLFQENGTVTFHYDGNDYNGTYSIMDPHFADSKINCILTVSYTDKASHTIYDCTIERHRLMLNDMSLSEVVDATETYSKIK